MELAYFKKRLLVSKIILLNAKYSSWDIHAIIKHWAVLWKLQWFHSDYQTLAFLKLHLCLPTVPLYILFSLWINDRKGRVHIIDNEIVLLVPILIISSVR